MSIGNTTCFRWTSLGITFHAPFWNGLELLVLAQCFGLGCNVLALGNCPSHDPPRSIVFRRGYYVDTVGRNKTAISEYIKNQLQEDIAADQISLKEYCDPFTGSKNTKA